MSEPGSDAPITLDQLRVFLAVVESGSFSSAARRLRRVQSAVSYAIANLERLLEVELFDRTGRRPVLTPSGKALVADAQAVSERVDRLQARARGFARGIEARLSVAVDVLYPLPGLLCAVRQFQQEFPTVELHLRTEALGAVIELVLDGTCQLGISTDLQPFPRELTRIPLLDVEMVAVCATHHRLAAMDRVIGDEDIADEVQIVVSDRSARTEGEDRGVLSPQTWRVADLGAKRELLLAGVGWGSMPRHRVREDLAEGRLSEMRIEGYAQRVGTVPLLAIHRTAEPPGPAGSWLLERFGQTDE